MSAEVEDADATLIRLLHQEHAGPLYAFCVCFTGNPQRAEDIVQEVFLRAWFLRAWRSLSGTDLRTGPVRPWLLQVARNLLTDPHRAGQSGRSWSPTSGRRRRPRRTTTWTVRSRRGRSPRRWPG